MSNFVSLHNQTVFSLLDSLCSVQGLFDRAKELNQEAIAITDHGSLASAWDALKASKASGVKLIIGCECYFTDDVNNMSTRLSHLILIAKNAIGYRNLLTLNKLAFDQGKIAGSKVYPIVDWKLLEQYSEGLICLTACGNGILAQDLALGELDKAEQSLLKLKDLFGDSLGVEVLANNMKRNATMFTHEIDQKFLNRRSIKLANKLGVKVVAACNTHYLKKEEYDTHNVLLSIGAKAPIHSNFRLRYPVNDFYLKSEDEMVTFFSRNFGEDFANEIVGNSKVFSDMCEDPEWIDPKYSNPSGKELPEFPIKDELDYKSFKTWLLTQDNIIQNLDEDKSYLRYKCSISLDKFFKTKKNKAPKEKYIEQLNEEYEVLEYHGFSSYMLIVGDYLNWARDNAIAVGTGRGSAGGSLVAFLLNIHVADPIKYGLIFARFHNKAKTSFPDIDVDISPLGRNRVHEYIRNKYGVDCVAHVSNVNRITPKVYVRDIARSCELGGSRDEAVKIGNNVADCIPADVRSIDAAYANIPLFAEYCKKYPEFLQHKHICNQFRAWSTHAGGIIISARSLVGLVPLRKDKEGSLALEYDKDKAEENGLVKMDTLGLSTLAIMTVCDELITAGGKEIPIIDYDVPDKKTYELISKGDTFGVFQLGTSGGTIDLCKKIKPKNIEDISHINALARPSARDMRADFIKAKNEKSTIPLLDPTLKRAFEKTFGFGLYEESLMFLAQDVAGWSLHDADKLRKMTKAKGKYPEKVAQWRKEFIDGSVKNGVLEEIGTRIWDETISLFGGYGFNLSHSIMYSMISYQTAYYKAHYPVEFLLANLMFEVKSNAPTAKSNIEKIKNEIRQKKIKILPPNINDSKLAYTMVNDKTLLTGLDALKYVGEDAINDIINKRPFKSFQDFMCRISSKAVRANTIQALTAAGALDCFCEGEVRRKDLFLYCSDYRKKLTSWKKTNDPEKDTFIYPWVNDDNWSLEELYAQEVFYLNEGFVCKPHLAYGDFFNGNQYMACHVMKAANRQKLIPLKGIVTDFFSFKVKKEGSKFYGQEMAKVTIEDRAGEKYSCTIFPDRWSALNRWLKSLKINEFCIGIALEFEGTANLYEDNMGVILNNAFSAKQPPSRPSDLKSKKASIRSKKAKIAAVKDIVKSKGSINELEEKIEDFLYEEGVLELE